ncbi:MAG: hypothetical protein WBF53_05015 [Litorimonas sp.]
MRAVLFSLRKCLVATAAVLLSCAAPAHAFLGSGIVYDPSNFAQNVLTASRTLAQVRQQAEMLRNQARQLIRQGLYVGPEMDRVLADLNRLTHEARGLTYRIDQIEAAFEHHFPEEFAAFSVTEQAQIADAQQDAAAMAFRDSIRLQAHVMDAVQRDQRQLQRLLDASQASDGNLAVMQAGNQLTALSAKQTMQLQQVMVAQYRADAIERSRVLYVEQAADARHAAFMGR